MRQNEWIDYAVGLEAFQRVCFKSTVYLDREEKGEERGERTLYRP